MLRPQDGPTRERKRLDGLWRFRLDPAGAGRDEGWWQRPPAGGRDTPRPARYNAIPAHAGARTPGPAPGPCPFRPGTTTSRPMPPAATTSGTPGTRRPYGCPAAGPVRVW